MMHDEGQRRLCLHRTEPLAQAVQSELLVPGRFRSPFNTYPGQRVPERLSVLGSNQYHWTLSSLLLNSSRVPPQSQPA